MFTKRRGLELVPKILAFSILFFAFMHILSVLVLQKQPDNATMSYFASMFDLDNERNIPTLYSSLLLGMCAFVCVVLSTRAKVLINKLVYYAIGAFFLYVAFDESLVIHETSAEPVRNLLQIGDGSALYHAWVIPAVLVLLGIAGVYAFLRSKDKETKFQKKIILLICILGAGVVGLEVLGTQFYFDQTAYKLGPVMIEELFELGMVSFILATLSKRLSATAP